MSVFKVKERKKMQGDVAVVKKKKIEKLIKNNKTNN